MNPLNAIPGVAQAKLAWQAGKVWFYVGVAVLLFAMGAYCGHRWEVGKTVEQKVETTKAQAARDAWKASSEGWQKASKAWSDRYAADEKASRELASQANKILDDLAKMQDEAKRRQRDWDRKFNEAKGTPECAELMKDSRCAALRSY